MGLRGLTARAQPNGGYMDRRQFLKPPLPVALR
jgi:hypothetical protein